METALVTEPEFRKGEEVFRRAREVHFQPAPPDEHALAQSVANHGARAVILGVTPYRGPLYEALARQGPAIIARFGVGLDNIDLALARRHGILITNTPGALDQSVAEHTLWLMGCLARGIAQGDACVRAGQFTAETGGELHGRTLGILGLGNIGRRVAAMARFGFGMRVLACGRRASVERLAECGVGTYTVDPEELLRQSDFLSLHLASNTSTWHFLDAQKLAWLKPSAMLVNTARGALLDEAALFDALAGGRLAGAALDVFEHEPYRPVHPDKDLRRLDKVLLTPHIGSNTHAANRRMAEACLANVQTFLNARREGATILPPRPS